MVLRSSKSQRISLQHSAKEFYTGVSSRICKTFVQGNWPNHHLLGVFLHGLKEELKSIVRAHKPRIVYRAMSLALEFENKFGPFRSKKGSNWVPTSASNIQNPLHSSMNTQNNFNSSLQNPRNNASFKSVLPSLFKCKQGIQREEILQHEHFVIVALRNLHLVIDVNLQNYLSWSLQEEINWKMLTTLMQQSLATLTNIAEIWFHAILGQSVGATMKLQGKINHRKVLILVDSGATHNFVAESVVEKHKLTIEMAPTFGVQIGNKYTILCNTICWNLQIQLSGFTITQDYYPFAFGEANLLICVVYGETPCFLVSNGQFLSLFKLTER